MESRFITAETHSTPADPVYWVKAFNFFLTHANGNPTVTITYAFKESGQNVIGENLRAMSQAEKDNVLDAIAKVTADIGLSMVEGNLATATIVFGISDDPDQPAVGVTYTGGQIQVIAYDRFYMDHDVSGNEYIFKHELMHALGLDHSTALFGGTGSVLIPDTEDDGTTLYGNWSPYWANDIQLFDLAALQYMYGPNPLSRAGDDVYAPDGMAFDPFDPEAHLTLIWDGGGYDSIDFSSISAGVDATLVPGVISRIGGALGGILEAGTFAINYRTEIERLVGSAGNDTLTGNDHANELDGDWGDDILNGGDGGDTLEGDVGADTLHGETGDDTMDGGADNDTMGGEGGRDSMLGGDGADTVHGFGSHDSLYGGNGNDDLRGGFGKDLLNGSADNDAVRGFEGDDRLFGGGGVDTLLGGDDQDSLIGGGGGDRLKGDDGNDTINGSFGADTSTGGLGDDLFEFRKTHGADVIDDFTAGAASEDVVKLIAFGAAFDTFAEVIAAASDDGTDTTIDFGGGDMLILEGVLVAALHADDFAFG